MAVTVEMIASKEFKVVSKGYDPSEVDDFLNDICEEMEGLEDDIKQLRSALTKAEATPAPVVAAPAPLRAKICVPAPKRSSMTICCWTSHRTRLPMCFATVWICPSFGTFSSPTRTRITFIRKI